MKLHLPPYLILHVTPPTNFCTHVWWNMEYCTQFTIAAISLIYLLMWGFIFAVSLLHISVLIRAFDQYRLFIWTNSIPRIKCRQFSGLIQGLYLQPEITIFCTPISGILHSRGLLVHPLTLDICCSKRATHHALAPRSQRFHLGSLSSTPTQDFLQFNL